MSLRLPVEEEAYVGEYYPSVKKIIVKGISHGFWCFTYNAFIMPNAEAKWREPLKVGITNCIWRHSWVIVLKELRIDAFGSWAQALPFVKYRLSVCGWILNSTPLHKLFIYLLVQAVNLFALTISNRHSKILPVCKIYLLSIEAWVGWQINDRLYHSSVSMFNLSN